ncbi:thioredoxin-dependent thiol peroxidase [Thermostilla marina]
MILRWNRSVVAFAVVSLSVFSGGILSAFEPTSSEPSKKELKVGDPAPDFALPGSDGKLHKLSQYRGKYVVVAWFPKAFTGGCTRECTAFAQKGDLFKDLPVVYFTASVDTLEENTRFAKSVGASYPILSDPTKGTAKAYGVVDAGRPVPYRWTFIIDKNGKIAHIDKAVKVDSHPEDVLAVLKKLIAAEKAGD